MLRAAVGVHGTRTARDLRRRLLARVSTVDLRVVSTQCHRVILGRLHQISSSSTPPRLRPQLREC